MSSLTREVELKARVDDVDTARRNMESAGAMLVFEGQLSDRVYDTSRGALAEHGLVLRIRSYSNEMGMRAHLDWKGPTTREDGFKVRAELTTGVSDPDALAEMLGKLDYEVVSAIDRDIAQYELRGSGAKSVVMIRFERYPRMDTLVEVEGTPAGIEEAIRFLDIDRGSFNADRLSDFVRAYEARTGHQAAICQAELESL